MNLVAEAYWQGVADCRLGRPRVPPASDARRRAYLQGWRDERAFTERMARDRKRRKGTR